MKWSIVTLWMVAAIVPAMAISLLPSDGRLACFYIAVLLDAGHSLSPIVVGWSHRDFRQRVILPSLPKYIALPTVLFCGAITIGILTSAGWTTYLPNTPDQMLRLTDWTNPFPVLFWVYLIWNAYHFGMQNFGVLALSWPGMPRGVHRIDYKIGCIALTVLGMYALPQYFDSWSVSLICFGAFSFNHWIVAIGLCSRVSQYAWLFIAGVLTAGAVGFVWMIPTYDAMMIRAIPWIISARLGLGFVHFLYDRWIWKMSNPEVRATIGRDLFRVPPPIAGSKQWRAVEI